LRDITHDLERWRKEVVANKYTPKVNIIAHNLNAKRTFSKFREITK
jgi:hypothetical protein